ncbi:PA2779 family protein [Pseudodesulfovibrio cashew]|uniref:PA2779 family protein n=1 Tax=Pseudodesulfovibrio cashew TaxID=2678688 RepID=A0A6I6JPW3_9BACT|nr:PA2779 family protein [Pseudodesulfovibrio cashew]QGY39684.1 PA2779 family protein [Pseudodesulfovibrio cashew]
MWNRIVKYACYITIVCMMVLNVSVPMAKAEMISTETSIAASQSEANRDLVRSFFQRDDLRQALTERGINVDEAQARIDSLSDEEVASLADRIQDMPAGAGALGTILGAALLVFIILLITDIAGATDVFPFVKKQ